MSVSESVGGNEMRERLIRIAADALGKWIEPRYREEMAASMIDALGIDNGLATGAPYRLVGFRVFPHPCLRDGGGLSSR